MWSPLLSGNGVPGTPPQNLLYNYYTQTWVVLYPYDEHQYDVGQKKLHTTINPVFDPVKLTTQKSTPGAREKNDPVNGASVTLTRTNNKDQTYIGRFKTKRDWSAGLIFKYQFSNYVPGDMMTVYDATPGGQYQLAFVMDPSQIPAQTDALKGTISLGSHSIASYNLKFTLTSTAANPNSSVTIYNLMQYANPSTLPGKALRPPNKGTA
jgi:hypothetical protein